MREGLATVLPERVRVGPSTCVQLYVRSLAIKSALLVTLKPSLKTTPGRVVWIAVTATTGVGLLSDSTEVEEGDAEGSTTVATSVAAAEETADDAGAEVAAGGEYGPHDLGAGALAPGQGLS